VAYVAVSVDAPEVSEDVAGAQSSIDDPILNRQSNPQSTIQSSIDNPILNRQSNPQSTIDSAIVSLQSSVVSVLTRAQKDATIVAEACRPGAQTQRGPALDSYA
jgi:hypothetical protein